MGWLHDFEFPTKTAIVAGVKTSSFWGEDFVVLDFDEKPRHIWCLVLCPSGKSKIFQILLRPGTDPGEGWGYKIVPEDDGPLAYNCPKRLISGASKTHNSYAIEWRNRVLSSPVNSKL